MLLFHLIVEKLYQLALNDFIILIGSILDAYSETQYKEEACFFFCFFFVLKMKMCCTHFLYWNLVYKNIEAET